MITTDRNIAIMAHVTYKNKEKFRAEAARRHMSMSELISVILEQWLESAPSEIIEKKRSNKRDLKFDEEIFEKVMDPLKDVPLPLEEE